MAEVELPRARWGPLTGRGAGAAAIGAVLTGLGLWWHYATVFGIGLALVVLVILEVVLVRRRVRLSVSRHVSPQVVERHAECWARVGVQGRLPQIVTARVSDKVGRTEVGVPLTSGEASYRVPTLRRGLLRVGPLRVDLVGPFALAARQLAEGDTTGVRVLPRHVPAQAMARGRRRSAVGADESLEVGGTDLVGLHEYVAGDDLRRLHWATSARTGILMVRDDAEPAAPHLTVILDDHGPHYGDHGSLDTDFEDAVEVAFALCRAAVDARQPVQLLTTSGLVDVTVSERVGAAEAEAQSLYAAVAEVQAVVDPERPSAQPRLPRGGLDTVVVVSGSKAPLPAFEQILAGAATPVIALIDATDRGVYAGRATLLHGARSVDVVAAWDRRIA